MLERCKRHERVQLNIYQSNDLQHDLFRDLDQGSNFEVDLFRSTYSSFDTSRRDKRDAGKISVIQVLSPKLWCKNLFRKNASLEAKTLTLGQVCEHYSEMLLKALSNALSRSIATLLVPDLCADLWKVVKIWNKISWKFYSWWPVVTSAMTW